MSEARDYIQRTLSWTDAALKTHTVRDQEIIWRFSEPIVILGDPGIGKTWLMEMLAAHNGHQFIRATSLLRQPDGCSFGNARLVIDGLDEVAAINEGDPLHNVLAKLIACGKTSFHIVVPLRRMARRICKNRHYGRVWGCPARPESRAFERG